MLSVSSASFGLGGEDGSMVIDLQAFQTIANTTLGDLPADIVAVGAGVRLGNLALGIYSLDRRAMPHGINPGVGIGGHATHGGYGM